MKLNEFITQTLSEIVLGTDTAREALRQSVAVCCHTDREYNGIPSVSYHHEGHNYQAPLTVVGFKVQVEVADSLSAEGHAGASLIKVVSGTAGGTASLAKTSVHEVSFDIPLAWKKRKEGR